MLFSLVLILSCSPAQLIREPKLKPMPKVDTRAQEARQHLFAASCSGGGGSRVGCVVVIKVVWDSLVHLHREVVAGEREGVANIDRAIAARSVWFKVVVVFLLLVLQCVCAHLHHVRVQQVERGPERWWRC